MDNCLSTYADKCPGGHCGGALKQIVVISDGEPADIDVSDTEYLLHDAAHAVKHLHKTGIDCFCINLNVQTARQVIRIFGQNGYRALNDIAALPTILPSIYLRLRA